MNVLVDSDILIELARGRNEPIAERWAELAGSDVRILYSPVSSAELWAGAYASEKSLLDALFGALDCVVATDAIGRKAGEYLKLYRKSHALEIGDALIAASAVVSQAALWTRNRKHYPVRELNLF